ncbi:hypothetical protein LCGC14_2050020 [marine sediment metagenome]|uniref:DUF4326 domain-containing protein n=1 Tax=marine sediment metagenome TaxID=412755 RepID=A0A0F9HL99_9ZZZZ
MKTTVVNLRTYKDPNVVRADRTTSFGNPFHIGKDGNREMVVSKHKIWLIMWLKRGEEIIIGGYSNKWVCQHVKQLRGRKLGCWCVPRRCHVENLIWLLRCKND